MGTGQSSNAPGAVSEGGVNAGDGTGSPGTISEAIRGVLLPTGGEIEAKKQVVPTQFRWPYGGRQVYIAGSFNDWKGKVPMKADPAAGGDADGSSSGSVSEGTPIFTITLDLPPGTHYYKFIVDDQWQYDPGKDRMINHQGVVNNVIEVKASQPLQGPAPSPLDMVMGDPGSYGQEIPRDFSADPPPLPPQLGMLPHLNPPTTSGSKSSELSGGSGAGSKNTLSAEQPLHVTLNHACFRQDQAQLLTMTPDLLVLGVTQRYRAKGHPNSKERFVTTIYYKPRASNDQSSS